MTDVELKIRRFGYSPKPGGEIWEYKIGDWYPSGTIKEVFDVVTRYETEAEEVRKAEALALSKKRLAKEAAELKKEWLVYWLIQAGQLTFALLCLIGFFYVGKLSGEFFKVYGNKPITLRSLSGYLFHLVTGYYFLKSAGTLFGFIADQKRPRR